MSEVKANAMPHGMKYELAGTKGVKNPSEVLRKAYKLEVQNRSSIYTLALLAYKHRVGLLSAGCIVLVLNWLVPSWASMLSGLVH